MSETPLSQFRRHGLRVTDFSDQAWCEQQLEFVLHHGREQTEVMRQGASRHQELHAEITEILEVKTETREDWWGLRMLNTHNALLQLAQEGICREIPVLGQIQGVWLMGIIDQLHYDEHHSLRLIDTKTRRSPSLPSEAQKRTTRIQLMLYRYLFDQRVRENLSLTHFYSELELDPEASFSAEFIEALERFGIEDRSLSALIPRTLHHFQQTPCIADPLEIRYEWQEDRSYLGSDTFPFQAQWLEQQIKNSLVFWHGQREAQGVPFQDKWKCRYCQFQSRCSHAFSG